MSAIQSYLYKLNEIGVFLVNEKPLLYMYIYTLYSSAIPNATCLMQWRVCTMSVCEVEYMNTELY